MDVVSGNRLVGGETPVDESCFAAAGCFQDVEISFGFAPHSDVGFAVAVVVVPDDAVEKLFDPFYRIESDRSRQTGGTGLGLAIVKTCVEACRGKVYAENLSPNGLAVTILLKK